MIDEDHLRSNNRYKKQASQALRRWDDDETQKLNEFVRARQDLLRDQPDISQHLFFEVISQQLKDAGYERSIGSCDKRWRRLHPDEDLIPSSSTGGVEPFNGEIHSGQDRVPDISFESDSEDFAIDDLKTSQQKAKSKWTTQEIWSLETLMNRPSSKGLTWLEISKKHKDQGYERTACSVQQQWRKMNVTYDSEDDDIPLAKLLEKERQKSNKRFERKRNSVGKVGIPFHPRNSMLLTLIVTQQTSA